MGRPVALATIILFAVAMAPALAGSAKVGSATISLPAPKGFCELSATSDPSEKRTLTLVGEIAKGVGNRLLGMSADCQQLTAWDAGQRKLMDDLASYQSRVELEDKPQPPIKETCATLRSKGDQITKDSFQEIKDNLQQVVRKLTYDSISFAGVLDEDANACYAAALQKIHTEIGTEKVLLTEWATTLVKAQTIYVYRTGVYSGSNTSSELLAKLKETVAAFYAANPG
jgi:hypothetical protein